MVIGILIALSINNWNAHKKDRLFEIKMLKEIHKALIQDYDFFTTHILGRRNQTELEAVAFFDNAIITSQVAEDSIDYHFNRLDYGLKVTYNDGPYEALKASGLDKITNDDLRARLINYYDFIVPRYEGLIIKFHQESTQEMRPLIHQLGYPAPTVISDTSVIRRGLSLREIDFKKDEYFNHLIYLTKERATTLKYLLEEWMPYMLELIEHLDKEIEQYEG